MHTSLHVVTTQRNISPPWKSETCICHFTPERYATIPVTEKVAYVLRRHVCAFELAWPPRQAKRTSHHAMMAEALSRHAIKFLYFHQFPDF
jgi:hypothetical protein